MLLQDGAGTPRAASVTIAQAVIAGWTGRDADAVTAALLDPALLRHLGAMLAGLSLPSLLSDRSP